jgi:hypothetical protein
MKKDSYSLFINSFLLAFPSSLSVPSEEGNKKLSDLIDVLSFDFHVLCIQDILERVIVNSEEDYEYLGTRICNYIFDNTSDVQIQSQLFTIAFNHVVKSAPHKDSYIAFITPFPKDLPIKGMSEADNIGEMISYFRSRYKSLSSPIIIDSYSDYFGEASTEAKIAFIVVFWAISMALYIWFNRMGVEFSDHKILFVVLTLFSNILSNIFMKGISDTNYRKIPMILCIENLWFMFIIPFTPIIPYLIYSLF